jgi:hypothetical protein
MGKEVGKSFVLWKEITASYVDWRVVEVMENEACAGKGFSGGFCWNLEEVDREIRLRIEEVFEEFFEELERF